MNLEDRILRERIESLTQIILNIGKSRIGRYLIRRAVRKNKKENIDPVLRASREEMLIKINVIKEPERL